MGGFVGEPTGTGMTGIVHSGLQDLGQASEADTPPALSAVSQSPVSLATSSQFSPLVLAQSSSLSQFPSKQSSLQDAGQASEAKSPSSFTSVSQSPASLARSAQVFLLVLIQSSSFSQLGSPPPLPDVGGVGLGSVGGVGGVGLGSVGGVGGEGGLGSVAGVGGFTLGVGGEGLGSVGGEGGLTTGSVGGLVTVAGGETGGEGTAGTDGVGGSFTLLVLTFGS